MPATCVSLLLHSSRFSATRNHRPAVATCLAMQWTPLSSLTSSCTTYLLYQPRCAEIVHVEPPVRTSRQDQMQAFCGTELFCGTSARRLWWRHDSAAHLPLSPHLVLKVLVCSLEICHLLEQQLAQRVFVLFPRLRATSIAYTDVGTVR